MMGEPPVVNEVAPNDKNETTLRYPSTSDALGAEIKVSIVTATRRGHHAAITDAWRTHRPTVPRSGYRHRQADCFCRTLRGCRRPVAARRTTAEGADYNASIMLVSNVKKDSKYIGSLPDGEMWFHHDMCYDKAHAGRSCMRSSCRHRRRAVRQYVRRLRQAVGRHEATRAGQRALQIYDFATRETVDISDDISKYKHEIQPVTITHPVTGRRALYVNPLITARIEDMAEHESRAMLDELFAFADDPSIAYEHEWRLGDLMMWDNWCSCHARTDFPASERRMLRRCTVKGQPLHE